MPKLFKLYIIWAVLVFVVVFLKNGLSVDNITHLLILGYLGLGILWHKKHENKVPLNPQRQFIVWGIISASLVELFYMIQMPVFSELRITAGMSIGQMLKNYIIDLLFTVPAYFFIFKTIWHLVNKYKYSLWQYIILMALGQAMGDGSRTFLGNPAPLVFLPYVMANYHAMNILPFLKIKSSLAQERSDSLFKYLSPVILLPLVYIACGLIIYSAGSVFGLK